MPAPAPPSRFAATFSRTLRSSTDPHSLRAGRTRSRRPPDRSRAAPARSQPSVPTIRRALSAGIVCPARATDPAVKRRPRPAALRAEALLAAGPPSRQPRHPHSATPPRGGNPRRRRLPRTGRPAGERSELNHAARRRPTRSAPSPARHVSGRPTDSPLAPLGAMTRTQALSELWPTSIRIATCGPSTTR